MTPRAAPKCLTTGTECGTTKWGSEPACSCSGCEQYRNFPVPPTDTQILDWLQEHWVEIGTNDGEICDMEALDGDEYEFDIRKAAIAAMRGSK